VVSDRLGSSVFTTSRQLRTSDSKYIIQVKPGSTRYDTGKAIKYNFAFCVAGNAGEKGTFGSIFNLKYFIQAAKFWRPTQKLLWPSCFLSCSYGPSETWCGLLGTI
jgi:hypothetical protein